MIIALWSAKGGSGVSTVCAGLAASSGGVLLDLAGDAQQLFGRPGLAESGFVDWLHADATVGADALAELIRGTTPSHLGTGSEPRDGSSNGAAIAQPPPWKFDTRRLLSGLAWLERTHRTVVVDLGTRDDPLANAILASADRSVVVLRPCVLSVRAVFASPRTVVGAVVVGTGSGRFQAADIEQLLGVPVVARVAYQRSIARCVDEERFDVAPPRRLLRSVQPLLAVSLS